MRFHLRILAVVSIIAACTSAAPSGAIDTRSGNPTSFDISNIKNPGTDADVVSAGNDDSSLLATLQCNTSVSSPTFHEVDTCISKVLYKKSCRQVNGNNKCTLVESSAGSSILLCGKNNFLMTCNYVAYAAQQIRDKCGKQGKASGSWYFDGNESGMRVVVN
ncbi:hypothetical protein BZA05DRAFT_447764 [Tricharina praecox]|uniref:uncharacterized protein n=1 Tax=Tricharina praecox TaxID=43433 RepID=UPI002220B377|nr:uncharacterized protein BZA05DRAFT_447764 [Tricharina praecox]KAI5846027.1 hypothetical protein BZA05DRAFT_447764 [Tricharina praecox]